MEPTTAASGNFMDALKNFQPTTTPFHLVSVVGIAVLIAISGYSLIDAVWLSLIVIISSVLILGIFFTLIKHRNKSESYKTQLKFARSLGIGGGILGFLIAGDKALQYPELFFLIVVPGVAQILVFGFYIFIKDRTLTRSQVRITNSININYLQLCLITTAFLLGNASNIRNFQEDYADSNPDSGYFQAISESQIVAEAQQLIEESTNETTYYSNYESENNITPQKDKEKMLVDSLRQTYYTIISEKKLLNRKLSISYLLFTFWLSCIIIWLYFIGKNLLPDYTFKPGIE